MKVTFTSSVSCSTRLCDTSACRPSKTSTCKKTFEYDANIAVREDREFRNGQWLIVEMLAIVLFLLFVLHRSRRKHTYFHECCNCFVLHLEISISTYGIYHNLMVFPLSLPKPTATKRSGRKNHVRRNRVLINPYFPEGKFGGKSCAQLESTISISLGKSCQDNTYSES